MRRRRSDISPPPPTCHPEHSEGSRYVPIVIRRLINTSRQGGDTQRSDWKRRFKERGLRFEGAAVRFRMSDWHGAWERIPYLRLDTWCREISGLRSK